MKIILGSSSKQRREILSFFSIPFEVKISSFDEASVPFQGDPAKHSIFLAKGKNRALSNSKDIILTADTVVFFEGKIFEKPTSYDEAFFTLRQMSGKWHKVFTGVCVRKGEDIFHTGFEETNVLFHPLSDEQIQKYLAHLSFTEKAGGYTIQRSGSLIVSKIEGCYYNVMGLPIYLTEQLFKQVGIHLWDHLN